MSPSNVCLAGPISIYMGRRVIAGPFKVSPPSIASGSKMITRTFSVKEGVAMLVVVVVAGVFVNY